MTPMKDKGRIMLSIPQKLIGDDRGDHFALCNPFSMCQNWEILWLEDTGRQQNESIYR